MKNFLKLCCILAVLFAVAKIGLLIFEKLNPFIIGLIIIIEIIFILAYEK